MTIYSYIINFICYLNQSKNYITLLHIANIFVKLSTILWYNISVCPPVLATMTPWHIPVHHVKSVIILFHVACSIATPKVRINRYFKHLYFGKRVFRGTVHILYNHVDFGPYYQVDTCDLMRLRTIPSLCCHKISRKSATMIWSQKDHNFFACETCE